MKLPLSTAEKLFLMLDSGTGLPASSLAHPVVQKMIEQGVLQKIYSGRGRASVAARDPLALHAYLYNEFGIPDIREYIKTLSAKDVIRSESVMASGNSKLRTVRTFKGFMVNSFSPVSASWHGKSYVVQPHTGSFTFIYDYEDFIPAPDVTVVCIENPENFRYIELQDDLFADINPLFVTRYPYSHDLLKWLRDIVFNDFIYFGDLDFSGINIYLNEYRKHLGSRASFLIPEGVEAVIRDYGNRELYVRQLEYAPTAVSEEIAGLMVLFHRYKRVLEQEVFIGRGNH